MNEIGEKILEKLNDRAGAARNMSGNPYQDPQATMAFELLLDAYDWCFSLIEDILEEIEDEEE
jgi:hypothetical protein